MSVTSTPKYRKHSQRNLAFVVIDRRRVYLGKYGSPESQAAYHRLLLERSLAKAKAQPAPDPIAIVKAAADRSSVSIAELVFTYMRQHVGTYYRKRNGDRTSEQSSIKYALSPLTRLFGKTPAREFGPLKLLLVREEFIKLARARKAINQNIDRIRRMFKWAAAREMVDAELYFRLKSIGGLEAGRSDARETAPFSHNISAEGGSAPHAIVDIPIPTTTVIKRSNIVRPFIQARPRLNGNDVEIPREGWHVKRCLRERWSRRSVSGL